jgi:hypothetical protein
MLNTYIQNRGITQTIIHNKTHPVVNELKWNANYDGDTANISLYSNTNGKKQHYEIELDDQDLEAMLSIPSVDMPIDKRLQQDFVNKSFKYEPIVYQIELPIRELLNNRRPISSSPVIPKPPPNSYLSSPLPNEELIIPLMIDEKKRKKHTRNSTRRRLRRNAHKTYRVYKKRKSLSKFNPSIKHRLTMKNI